MTLVTGTKLGPYEILAPLGAGGMGEVYRARDTRLGRDVALKILPESFARDSERLHRFEQEARAVAALNHPNILAVFDVGRHNESPFLVSELLQGESLRAVLDRSALSQRKTVEYGVQIAQGLAAAHEKRIVHRDLKPENVFITKDGRIKILDFGLAKFTQKASAAATELDLVTLTSSHTVAGVVMGTASYMAPEQVRGDAADPRTDIFAFGAMLFEMLSGERAFRRETLAETMTAVLREDPPDLSDPRYPVSPALDRIVRRCLERNPEQRFQSAIDLSFALSALSGTDASGAVRASEVPRLAVARRMQFAIPVPGEVSHMALSRDGSMLAFVSPEENSALPMLYVQRIGAPDATLLRGTEGASYPFWSPTNAYVAFFANGKLWKLPISGGPPQVLARVSIARGGSWGRRNIIVYAPNATGEIWRINADGTASAPLTGSLIGKEEDTHRWPVFLPDGDQFLFWAGNLTNAADEEFTRVSGIYISSLAASEKKLITLNHSSLGYALGSLFYVDDKRRLLSVPFDLSRATVSDEPRITAELVGYQPSTYWAAFAVSENGTVVYNSSTYTAQSALTWFDRAGKELGRVRDPGILANPSLSFDGTRVAVDVTDLKGNNVDVWIEDLKTGNSARSSYGPSQNGVGVWSRDGKMIAFSVAFRSLLSRSSVVAKAATGLEREKVIRVAEGLEDVFPNSWSPDDKQILCTHSGPGGSDLVLVPASGGKTIPFLATKANEGNGQISPDGKWAAYASDESGDWEVYVTTFPDAVGKWQVSRGGGTEPRWRGDGKEIFYIGAKGMLMAVPVSGEGTFSTRTPTPLFPSHGRAPISSFDLFTYDVAKDGTRFLVNAYIKPEHVVPLTIVLHTTAEQEN